MTTSPWLAGTLSALLLSTVSCGGDTYCQGGPKYGTTCHSLSDVRQAPGQRPPLSSEPPNWWQPAPPLKLPTGVSAAPTGTSIPMSSPAWRPKPVIFDAGAGPDPAATD